MYITHFYGTRNPSGWIKDKIVHLFLKYLILGLALYPINYFLSGDRYSGLGILNLHWFNYCLCPWLKNNKQKMRKASVYIIETLWRLTGFILISKHGVGLLYLFMKLPKSVYLDQQHILNIFVKKRAETLWNSNRN